MLETSIPEVISCRERRKDIREIKGVSLSWGFGSWTLFSCSGKCPGGVKLRADFAGDLEPGPQAHRMQL